MQKSLLIGPVGAKLCMISNIIGSEGTGTVTGVDISPHRVATCRSLVKRYKVAERVRLFNTDGTTFKVYAPSRLGARVIREADCEKPDRKRQHISQGQTGDSSKPPSVKPFYAPKILRFDPQLQGEEYLYDKVRTFILNTFQYCAVHLTENENVCRSLSMPNVPTTDLSVIS